MLPLLLAVAITVPAENRKAGSPDWELTDPADNREIEGYASRTSIEAGGTIALFVSTADARYAIDVYRMGWYAGAGARHVAGPVVRDGVYQEMPLPDPNTGAIECRWREPYFLQTSDADGPWTTGVYLARLTALPSNKQSFIVFVVRNDQGPSPIVFQSSVNTFAAYNNWGGKSLYAFNSNNQPARIVSFDRPYATNPYGVRLDGAGDFLRRWEYNAVRWLEREGFDVSYITDVDTHERADAPGRRVFLSVGHDEYWSWQMRQHVESARDRGVHLGFLGADASYWQLRFAPNAAGEVNRRLIAYKEVAGSEDPFALDADAANNRLITGRWRDRPTSRPEERLVGVMYAADPVNADIVVDAASHWVFAGTGLRKGDRLRGLLGYEVDAMYGGGPAGLQRLAHSPFTDEGRTRYADMTIYTAASGALVFATGSMQWTWGLDGYNAPAWHSLRESVAAQRITRNVLDRMLATDARPHTRSRIPRSWVIVFVVAVALGIITGLLSRHTDRPR